MSAPGAARRFEAGKLLRFVAVGGGFSVAYSALTAALVGFGAPPFWTALVLYAAAIPLAYWAQKAFTFRIKAARRGAFLVYVATQLGSFALIASVTARFVTRDMATDFAIYLGTAGLAAVLSYAVNTTLGMGRGA